MSVQGALAAGGAPAAKAKVEAPRASKAMLEQKAITTQARSSYFLAQVLHESARLVYFEEIASGSAYEGRRDLGNIYAGDGRRYKGRCPIQLTGRANYRAAGKALGLPLEQHPELAARHDVGWRIAAWYWRTRGLNAFADRGDFIGATRAINGGTNGLADRQLILRRVRTVDCRPALPDGLAHLTAWERPRVRELDRLRAQHKDVARRRELAAELLAQRKAIWRLARPKADGGDGRGWQHAHRAERYASLKARTA